ncbi:MAG: hypothetical protein OXC91_00240, partial [Rhodobacteraceae bacterium]|nr:hypothetical protein [Paracoccaceae bacterium]
MTKKGGMSWQPAAFIERGFMLLAFLGFMTFLLAPAVFVFKGSIENLAVSLVASEPGLTSRNYLVIWNDGYFRYVLNSLSICIASS